MIRDIETPSLVPSLSRGVLTGSKAGWQDASCAPTPLDKVVTGEMERLWEALRAVPDPEIPVVSIVDLGIVRSASEHRVILTPTYTGCPATQVIETMVRAALDEAGFAHVAIETTLSPPWTTDWITAEGRAALHAYGIAPPSRAATATCPQCGSSDTQEVSRFGSTPCKALWRCRACAEPFDRFKCH